MELRTATAKIDPRMNRAPDDFKLPEGFLEFLAPLHRELTPRQQTLVARRAQVLAAAHRGQLPSHLTPMTGDWKIELPDWCRDQRNQMTGPADDAELVVKMLNSGAPGVMLDLEDSIANTWPNLMRGVENIRQALEGTLTYLDKKRNRTVGITQSQTVICTRPRGLHLTQVLQGDLIAASLFDTALVAFRLRRPPAIYIPKSESAEEALWWRDLFRAIELAKGWPPKSIRCMALVESHPMAFQIEEFIHNLREHLIGLNLGRWDYMASLIHFNLKDPRWVLPDRNMIPFDVPFFQNLRHLLVELCHKRGIFAIGGMTALFPDRQNAELNARALQALARDKKNESNCGFDGAWTGHPDQNEIALQQFPTPNQLSFRRPNAERIPDLRPLPTGVGQVTLDGTRAAVRTVIRYRLGVLKGKGASLLDGYMEDLATDRIYRLMIAQRTLHGIVTPAQVTHLFHEEAERLQDENADKARQISERMIARGEFDPV